MRPLQQVEFFVRSIPLRLLVAAAGRGEHPPIPDWRARDYRILFIRDDGIGDLILTMETLRAITEASPTITLDLLASPQNQAFARTLPFISDVIVHRRSGGGLREARRTIAELRRRHYDVVIDGRATISTVKTYTGALMLGTGAPWRIGVGRRRNDWLYTVRTDPSAAGHIQEVVASLAQPFGVQLGDRDWRARLALDAPARDAAERTWNAIGAGRPRVLVNVSVGNAERYWRLDRYAPVLARLRERLPRATILVSAMPAEQSTAAGLAAAVRGAAVPLTFGEVMGAVATADLVITPDTAITHVASGFQVPTLALMRKGTQAWAPYRTPGRVAYGDRPRVLEPGLPESRVVAELEAVIDELGPTKGWL